MTFWFLSFGLAALAAAAIGRAMLRPAPPEAEHPDMRVYRDQLAEIERDLARGLLAEDEAERTRTEVARRLLEADRAGAARQGGSAPPALSVAGAAVAAVMLLGGAGLLYFELGAPGYPDLPLERRIAQAEELRQSRPTQAAAVELAAADLPDLPAADPEFLQLMDRLRATVAERPDDIEGQRLLARNEAGLGNFTAAATAQQRILELSEAPSADAHATLASYLVNAAAGYVSPEAEAAVARALELDREQPQALYFAGLLHIQIGRPDLAFRYWRRLAETGPPDAPWAAQLRDSLPGLAELAGVEYRPAEAAAPRGPSADDMAAAAEMSAEDRQEMIRGMVEGLSQRLAAEGGPPEDWARLIRAYGVLGQPERAAAMWAEAQQVFTGAALAPVRAAARAAGVAEAAGPTGTTGTTGTVAE
jgi:cytochrome c-type biogenesis protein CcmH